MVMRFAVGALLGLAFSLQAGAQNLLNNAEFDADLSGWQLAGSPLPAWDSTDIDDAPGSGSALIANTESTATSDVEVLSQCVVVGVGDYIWGAHALISSGQASTGSVVVRLLGYSSSTNCTGNIFASSGRLGDEFDQWQLISGETSISDEQLVGPQGSLEFIIAIRKTEAGGEFNALVDNTFLNRPPEIFSDRFEAP